MLPASNRIKCNTDFQKIFKQGATAAKDFLLLKYLPNNLKKTRIGMSVGLKYSKKATDRNKAKRILRACAASQLENIKPGYDIIFFLKNTNPEKFNAADLPLMMSQALYYGRLISYNRKHN